MDHGTKATLTCVSGSTSVAVTKVEWIDGENNVLSSADNPTAGWLIWHSVLLFGNISRLLVREGILMGGNFQKSGRSGWNIV